MSLNMLRECESALGRGVNFHPYEQCEADSMLGGGSGVPCSTWLKDRNVKSLNHFCEVLRVGEDKIKSLYKQNQKTKLLTMVNEYRKKIGMRPLK